jgi:transcriptional regulator with XRE-family HTH domain
MSDGIRYDAIPERELVADFFDNLHRAYTALRAAFRSSGLTQDQIGQLLGDADKGLVSRWLSGKNNLTLRTLSRLASAMKCTLVIEFRPFDQLASSQAGNNYFFTLDKTPKADATTNKLRFPESQTTEKAA